jgi:hypothetical protein
MSLATLNKQRSVEKQSIKTTVTISKVSKTPITTTTTTTMPITSSVATSSQSKKIALDGETEQNYQSSSESPQTAARENTPDDIAFVDEINTVKRKELTKEKFLYENNGERRGELLSIYIIQHYVTFY